MDLRETLIFFAADFADHTVFFCIAQRIQALEFFVRTVLWNKRMSSYLLSTTLYIRFLCLFSPVYRGKFALGLILMIVNHAIYGSAIARNGRHGVRQLVCRGHLVLHNHHHHITGQAQKDGVHIVLVLVE